MEEREEKTDKVEQVDPKESPKIESRATKPSEPEQPPPRLQKLLEQLHSMYHEYEFRYFTEYLLFRQEISVFAYERKKNYANIKRRNKGAILVINYNPSDMIWNIADTSKHAVTNILRFANRTSPQRGQSSPNLFHSQSYTHNPHLFISEHDDTMLRREQNQQKQTRTRKEERTGEKSEARSGNTRMPPPKKKEEAAPDRPQQKPVQQRKAKTTPKKKSQSQVREEQPTPIDPADFKKISKESLEDFFAAARKKGWIKK